VRTPWRGSVEFKRAAHRWAAWLGLTLAFLSWSGSLYAQQDASTRSRPANSVDATKSSGFELEKENSERVAASPQQIREVLVKNSGMLVELKHLVSKEATSNGQVIDDSDLTDQAIFDRLDSDVVFRSAATRLLQRYGYLLPSVNPDSDLGKQQELVLKERARRLVQIEAQEDSESLKRPSEEDLLRASQRAEACDPSGDVANGNQGNQDQACGQKSQRRRQNLGASNAPGQSGPGAQGAPSPNEPSTTSPMMRVGVNSGLAESSTIALDSSADSMRLAALAGSRDGIPWRSSMGDAQSLADSLGGATSNLDTSSSRTSNGTTSTSAHRNSNSVFENGNRGSVSRDSKRDVSQGAIVHKQNPYADIPSLYDLYVQIPARDRVPERFGISILSDGLREPDAIPMDLPVGPEYVVGPGDSLAIDLWGGVSQRMLRVVDRQGRISLPEAGPLLVSGKTLGDVQMTVQEVLRSQYRDTSADVSLSRLRTIRVYVVGEVPEPGAYDISSLSSPLNALVAAGGVTQRGSLRTLKHYRGKELIEVVDAYDLLLRGVGMDQKRLETGDSLLVPPAGPQITIEGMVRRPAIYELSGETTLEEALELAGGVLPAAALQHVEVERLVAHQKRTMFTVDLSVPEIGDAATATAAATAAAKLSNFQVQDGDRIHIFPIAPYNGQAIYLQGHVLRPGRYSYKEGMNFGDLISSYSDLLPEPAGKYAEIIRLNPPDFRPTVESFDLAAALANPAASPKLKPLDTVRIFSKFDFEAAPNVWVGGEVRDPGLYSTSGQARLRDALYLAGGVSSDAALDSAQLFRTTKDGTMKILSVNLSGALAGDSTDNLLLEPHDRIIVHRNSAKVDPPTVYVRGEVAKPGRYPLTSNMRVEDLVSVAGGLKRSADSQNAFLAHQDESAVSGLSGSSGPINLVAAMSGETADDKDLKNGDVLTIRQTPGWNNLGASVTILGEVLHPGTYGILPGESLAAALAKAGGFTFEAFPYGTVLTRREVRELEMRSHNDLVERLKEQATQLKALPENTDDLKNAKLTAIAQTETTLTQLETNLPIGRVVIQSSTELKSFEKAAACTPLRNGDTILVPKKANYVMVTGQVFSPAAIGFVSGRSARWYMGQSGGLTQLADKNAVFVIRADGSILAAKNNGTMWSGDPLAAVLLPGDSIVVPEKAPRIAPKNWLPLIQVAQVATSVALAVAYLHP
jgi:protein involved in polysaccharide export with SLBB domain